jgi:hypothetical protein
MGTQEAALFGPLQPPCSFSPTSRQKWVTAGISPHIPAHRKNLRKTSGCSKALEIAAFLQLRGNPTRLDRTQEVGGSNPPSSIDRSGCTSAVSLFRAISNRR